MRAQISTWNHWHYTVDDSLSVREVMAADQHDLEGLDTAVDPSPNFDYMYKIVLVGDSGVGKTSLLDRYIDNKFSPTFVATLGIDFNEKSIFR